MDTVPAPPELDVGAEEPPEVADGIEAARKAAEAQAAKVAAAVQAAGGGGEAAAAATGEAAAADDDIHVEAQVDQETYDALIGEGKSERVARAKAKAAYVRKEKARIKAERASA
jgi:NADH-quinone oxidoreductase subunit I